MNLVGASICDEELIVQGEARDIQLPNTEHVSQISVDVSAMSDSHFVVLPPVLSPSDQQMQTDRQPNKENINPQRIGSARACFAGRCLHRMFLLDPDMDRLARQRSRMIMVFCTLLRYSLFF